MRIRLHPPPPPPPPPVWAENNAKPLYVTRTLPRQDMIRRPSKLSLGRGVEGVRRYIHVEVAVPAAAGEWQLSPMERI
jgi:hypothetical protein